MYDLMSTDVATLSESFATHFTRVWAFSSVSTLVSLGSVKPCLNTNWSQSSHLEISELRETLTAGWFFA